MKTSTGGTPYAIGILSNGWFRIRDIRFGKLAASYERRDGEKIRAIELVVSDKKAKPCKTM